MNTYKSVEEINKTYQDHLDSLEMSGLPFDRNHVLDSWNEALDQFSATR